MPITRGKDVLLKIDSGDGSFEALGGLRTKSFSLSAASIDATHAESGDWRELLPGGIRQANLAGSGVFLSDAAAGRAQALFFSGAHSTFQIVLPGSGTFEGPFQITNLDYAGEHRGEATYSVSLASAGEIVFTEEAV